MAEFSVSNVENALIGFARCHILLIFDCYEIRGWRNSKLLDIKVIIVAVVNSLLWCNQAFFCVRTRKKLKGAKTQEIGNSRKKLKLKKK